MTVQAKNNDGIAHHTYLGGRSAHSTPSLQSLTKLLCLIYNVSWAGTGWGKRKDYFSFPSLPTLTPDSSNPSLVKIFSHSPTFLCFKNFKIMAKHFTKKNWPSTKIDVHCRLHLSLLLKNRRTKMFLPSLFSLCPIFSSGSCDNRLRLVYSTCI